MKRGRIDDGKLNALAWSFYRKQQKLKAVQKQFEQSKAAFEAEMESQMEKDKVRSIDFGADALVDGPGQVLRVAMKQRTSIVWDAERLESRVTKPVRRKVIRKRYQIHDMAGLSRYLQSCGVDPEQFRKYVTVEKSVDQDEVDRLSQLGKISMKNISGCYVVKCQKPYFTLTVKKDNDNVE